MILESTFLSISDLLDTLFFGIFNPIKGLVLHIGWYTKDLVPNMSLPILYITGDQDTLIPMTHSERLHNLTLNSQLYIVKTAGHNDCWYVGGK